MLIDIIFYFVLLLGIVRFDYLTGGRWEAGNRREMGS